MASNANTITLTVKFQAQPAIAQIQQFNQVLASVGQVAAQTGAQVNVVMSQVGSGIDSLTQSVNAMAQAFAAMRILQFARDLVMLGDEMARLQRFFELNAAGTQMFDQLHAAAERTHTSFADMAKNAQLLVNAGMPLKDVASTVELLALRVKQAGGDQEDVNKAMQAFATLTAKGFVTGRELATSFISTGLIPMQILTKATGMNIQELRENLKLMDVSNLITLIKYQAEQDIQQSKIAERALTVQDALNDLKTAWADLAKAMSETFGESVRTVLGFLTQILQGLAIFIRALQWIPEGIRTVVVVLGTLAAALLAVYKVVKLFQEINLIESLIAIFTSPEMLIIIGVLTTIAGLLYLINKLTKDASGKGVIERAIGPSAADAQKAKENLFQPDVKKIEEANREAADLVDQAQKRYALSGKESIEALTYEYEIHFRKVEASAKAVAMARIAYEIDVATEVKKYNEQTEKDLDKSVYDRQTALRKIAFAYQTMEPDDTFAGRQRVDRLKAMDEEAQIREQANEKITAEQKRVVDQVAALRKAAANAQTVDEMNNFLKMADAYAINFIAKKKAWEAQADDDVIAHRAEAEKQALALLREYQKQQRDEETQDTIAAIERITRIRVAVLGTGIPVSQEDRLAQINAITDAQIRGTEEVRDTRLKAVEDELAIYKQLHPYSSEGMNEKEQEAARQRAQISKNAEADIQIDRINAWKESNQIIIEDQREMFNNIKGVFDQIWDAALNRSKSFWDSLGNIIKNTITSIFKSIVTNRLAGMFASMLGFGPYAYQGGWDITKPPVPMGTPNPFSMPSGEASKSVLQFLSPFSPAPWSTQTSSPASPSQGGAQRYILDEIAGLAQQSSAESGTVQAAVSSRGSRGRMMDENDTPTDSIRKVWQTAGGGTSGSVRQQVQMTKAKQIQQLKEQFNIGKPITITGPDGIPKTVPWSQATATQKLGSVLNSPGAYSMALGTGTMLAMAGFSRGTTGGLVQGVAGSTLAGIGLMGTLFPGLPLASIGITGGLLGLGAGVMAAGLVHGGVSGMAMSVGGGALMGAMIGTTILPGLGTAAGALIGAGIGAVGGALRLIFKTEDERIRLGVKRIYGIDIPDRKIRDQIRSIIDQTYGGNVNVGLYSVEVQNLIRLYAATTGQQAGLPRPMYNVTMAQQGGQLTTQPVYSNGQLVNNPYTGTTTYQYAQHGMYMQLNPNQAMQLFSGQVINVMQNNPAQVAQANAAALAAGNSRYSQAGSMLEPNTVMS